MLQKCICCLTCSYIFRSARLAHLIWICSFHWPYSSELSNTFITGCWIYSESVQFSSHFEDLSLYIHILLPFLWGGGDVHFIGDLPCNSVHISSFPQLRYVQSPLWLTCHFIFTIWHVQWISNYIITKHKCNTISKSEINQNFSFCCVWVIFGIMINFYDLPILIILAEL
jgi:hypothetical protein